MITRPLRDEHKELLPELESLLRAAESVDSEPADEVSRKVRAAQEFLERHLIPHAQTEDRVLYPEVERLLGAPGATATMRRDHQEVGRLAAELSELARGLGSSPAAGPSRSLRRVLYGLHAVVRLHFAKEEEVYLPLLDEKLSPAEGEALFAEMERVAASLKAS